jgi:hypothetical protein
MAHLHVPVVFAIRQQKFPVGEAFRGRDKAIDRGLCGSFAEPVYIKASAQKPSDFSAPQPKPSSGDSLSEARLLPEMMARAGTAWQLRFLLSAGMIPTRAVSKDAHLCNKTPLYGGFVL